MEDLETIAILDREEDRYTLKPYAHAHDFKVVTGVSGEEALVKAETFVSFHSSFSHSRLRKIISDTGTIIGYELRPLYLPVTFGHADVLVVDYVLEQNSVVVTIRVDPSIDTLFDSGG